MSPIENFLWPKLDELNLDNKLVAPRRPFGTLKLLKGKLNKGITFRGMSEL